MHSYTLYIHAWWNLLFYLFKCTIINFGLFFIYRCRDWSYFKTMVLISVYLNIQYNYKYMTWLCVDQEMLGWGWGEGCLRDTFFARKRRGGAFLYIPWEFEKYDNSAGSDSPAAPPPHYNMFKFFIHRYKSLPLYTVSKQLQRHSVRFTGTLFGTQNILLTIPVE